MLNIYVGEENLPKDKELIIDIEKFFVSISLRDSDFVRNILKVIEQGKYVDTNVFSDRFERNLWKDCLSTGSKLAIAIYLYPEYVYMCDEIGDNVLPLILNCENVNLYFNRRDIEFNGVFKDSILVNGNEVESLDELNYRISIS